MAEIIENIFSDIFTRLDKDLTTSYFLSQSPLIQKEEDPILITQSPFRIYIIQSMIFWRSHG